MSGEKKEGGANWGYEVSGFGGFIMLFSLAVLLLGLSSVLFGLGDLLFAYADSLQGCVK